MPKLLFRVNHNPENIDVDKYHDFKTIGNMRQYIDNNFGEAMTIEVWAGDENLITTPYNCYWVGEKHPTLKQLISGIA